MSRCSLATLQVMQHLLYQGASDLHSSRFKSPFRSIGGFIRKRQGFFLSTHTQDIGILWQVAFQQFLIAAPESTHHADCLRTTATHSARFHFPVHIRHHSPGFVSWGGNVQRTHADHRMRNSNCPFHCARCASAVAVSGRRADMQHRSAGRTGPWIAAGYAVCFRCERNGTTIRLQRHDQAPGRRYRRDKRGNAVLGCFCPKQPNRPRHAERKLRRRQRQHCRRSGFGRQGADRRIPPHHNVAAVVGRRPDRNKSGAGRRESHPPMNHRRAHWHQTCSSRTSRLRVDFLPTFPPCAARNDSALRRPSTFSMVRKSHSALNLDEAPSSSMAVLEMR